MTPECQQLWQLYVTMESGGSVTIELRPEESSYKGTTRNGIKTNDYGKYGQSFVVK